MGILNVTPDSFSDGGKYLAVDQALAHALEMARDGADIIDIGGQSTRPGAVTITPEEELLRVVPAVLAIRRALPKIGISVDTSRAVVAEAALKAGADMVNSLGGFTFDPELAEVVAKAKCQIVIYHTSGTPETMQKKPVATAKVIAGVQTFFKEQIAFGKTYGVKKDQFILDPGIGFGKSDEGNLLLVREFGVFKKWKLPLLVGVSRKSHLGRILQSKLKLKDAPEPTERIEAGLAETAVAVQNGAGIVRTHDVLATKKFLALFEELI